MSFVILCQKLPNQFHWLPKPLVRTRSDSGRRVYGFRWFNRGILFFGGDLTNMRVIYNDNTVR